MSGRPRIRLAYWGVVAICFCALMWATGLLAPPAGAAAPDDAKAAVASVQPAGAAAADVPDVCINKPPKKPKKVERPLYEKLAPIVLLIFVIVIVVSRLPKVDVGHSVAFRHRRVLNWLPLGLTYAFLYMGRYNMNQFMYVGAINEAQFGAIFGWGSLVYGLSFLLNGPLTDYWGGRVTILISASGSAVCNLAMGYLVLTHDGNSYGDSVGTLTLLYCANMYFQSFGAVSIVKVNAAWFHLRERGTFGGVFGILISLGVFFGYDGSRIITDTFQLEYLFIIPALLLVVFFVLCWLFVRDNPSDAGHADFDPGDASSHDEGHSTKVLAVMWRIVSNPIILTISLIELCSGFLRQAILQWGRNFGKGVGLADSFVFANWGVVSCIAGITGSMFAGAISDHVFHSRRLPVSAVLYGIMFVGSILILPMMGAPAAIPWIVAFMSMAIIGVHGMLSGTASQDFGGKKNAGIAVGIIDGFVYIGSTIQSFVFGAYLPAEKIDCPDGSRVANPAAHVIDNWKIWPIAMIPAAVIGLGLAIVLWNARADKKRKKS